MAMTVVGLFDTMNEAQSVVQDLVNSGFNRNDIGLTANNSKGDFKDTAKTSTGTTASTTTDTGTIGTDTGATKAGDDAGAGAVGGTVVGGALGLLVGIGALAIPGIGPVVAAGTLATVLGSTALGAGIGAGIGGIVGALVGMGVPKEDAEYYNEGVRRGGALVTVKAENDKAQSAYDVMQKHGAVDIDERGAEWKQTGYQSYDPKAQAYTPQQLESFRSTGRGATGTADRAATGATNTVGNAARTVADDAKGAVAGAANAIKGGAERLTGTAQGATNTATNATAGAGNMATAGAGKVENATKRGVYTIESDQMLDHK